MLHPALPDCPGHELWARDFTGATGLFSFVLDGGDEAARTRLIDGLELFGIGYSWGGYESLAVPADPVRTATRHGIRRAAGAAARRPRGSGRSDRRSRGGAGAAVNDAGRRSGPDPAGGARHAGGDRGARDASPAVAFARLARRPLSRRRRSPTSGSSKAGARGEAIQARICAMVRYVIARRSAWAAALALYPWPDLAVWLLGLTGAGGRGLAGQERSSAASTCRAGSPGCSPPSPSPPCSPTRSAGWRS